MHRCRLPWQGPSCMLMKKSVLPDPAPPHHGSAGSGLDDGGAHRRGTRVVQRDYEGVVREREALHLHGGAHRMAVVRRAFSGGTQPTRLPRASCVFRVRSHASAHAARGCAGPTPPGAYLTRSLTSDGQRASGAPGLEGDAIRSAMDRGGGVRHRRREWTGGTAERRGGGVGVGTRRRRAEAMALVAVNCTEGGTAQRMCGDRCKSEGFLCSGACGVPWRHA